MPHKHHDLTPSEEADLYADRSTKIDPLDMKSEYIKLPAHLAHWNARLADATENELTADLAFDRTESHLYLELREQLVAEGQKATEAMVTHRVQTDQRWVDAKMRLIEAEVELVRVKGVVTAIHAKREMLVSLGAHVRKEMEHDPTLRQASRDRSDKDGHSGYGD